MVQRIKIHETQALERAVEVILNGGVIVYPTDTLYGLGVDATNLNAVNRINQIKGRKSPVSVIADSVDRVQKWTSLDPSDFKKIEKYIGGAQTIILPARKGIVIPDIMGLDGTLGFRIPDVSFGPELVALMERPLTTTSVNRTGEPALNEPDLILDLLKNEIDLLIDAGTLPLSSGSSIYKYSDGEIERIR